MCPSHLPKKTLKSAFGDLYEGMTLADPSEAEQIAARQAAARRWVHRRNRYKLRRLLRRLGILRSKNTRPRTPKR